MTLHKAMLAMFVLAAPAAVSAQTCDIKHSSCNSEYGKLPMYTSTGAPAVAGQCYYCYATDYWTNCPSGTTFRADYFTYDDCCYPRACTSVGDCSYSSDGECDDGGEGSE